MTGKVIGKCFTRHRHDEFLRTIDTSVPRKLQVHLIVDNYGTHTHPNVKTWLDKHPRFHLHFTPTSSSWLNLVEQITTGLDGDRWSAAPEAVAYDMAGEVIGGPAGVPGSGTPA